MEQYKESYGKAIQLLNELTLDHAPESLTKTSKKTLPLEVVRRDPELLLAEVKQDSNEISSMISFGYLMGKAFGKQ